MHLFLLSGFNVIRRSPCCHFIVALGAVAIVLSASSLNVSAEYPSLRQAYALHNDTNFDARQGVRTPSGLLPIN